MQTHSLPHTARAVIEARQVISDPNIAAAMPRVFRQEAWDIALLDFATTQRMRRRIARSWGHR